MDTFLDYLTTLLVPIDFESRWCIINFSIKFHFILEYFPKVILIRFHDLSWCLFELVAKGCQSHVMTQNETLYSLLICLRHFSSLCSKEPKVLDTNERCNWVSTFLSSTFEYMKHNFFLEFGGGKNHCFKTSLIWVYSTRWTCLLVLWMRSLF
jgi:hypothetical protein